MFASILTAANLPAPANANGPDLITTTEKRFEVGKTYYTRSICDHDCIFRYEIVARTAKQITIRKQGKTFKRGVYVYDGIEHCKPDGTYSMCPVISADKQER
jgi:hypothetical protein